MADIKGKKAEADPQLKYSDFIRKRLLEMRASHPDHKERFKKAAHDWYTEERQAKEKEFAALYGSMQGENRYMRAARKFLGKD